MREAAQALEGSGQFASAADAKVVVAGSMRPGSRVVISWNSQPLPSGSWNEADERLLRCAGSRPLTRCRTNR